MVVGEGVVGEQGRHKSSGGVQKRESEAVPEHLMLWWNGATNTDLS